MGWSMGLKNKQACAAGGLLNIRGADSKDPEAWAWDAHGDRDLQNDKEQQNITYSTTIAYFRSKDT